MLEVNSGPGRVRTRVGVITLVGVLFFGLALLLTLPGSETSASTPPSATGSSAGPNDLCGQVVSSPNPDTRNGRLTGVAVVSANDMWAVGYYRNGGRYQTLVEHWNGSSWTIVPSPNQGTHSNELYGVTSLSTSDVWAVGFYDDGSKGQTLVEHWNGTAWGVVSSPNVGSYGNVLNGVTATGPNDVWAVGYYWATSASRTLIERWNGTAWSVVSSPNQGSYSNELDGVAVASSNDVWAVGYYDDGSKVQTLIERWNGTAWSIVSSPSPGSEYNTLTGVAVAAADDVWAVGRQYSGGTYDTLIERWNGTAWSVVSSPNQGTYANYLSGVAVAAADDVWAVGYYSNDNLYTTNQTLIERWNGSSWNVVPSSNPGSSNGLSAVAVLSANDVLAVGSYYSSTTPTWTLVERWDGTAWAIVPSPNQGSGDNGLSAVAAVSANDVWAVGTYYNGSLRTSTLIERWNGTAWAIVPSPNQETYSSYLDGVAAASTSDVWAVGYYYGDGAQTLTEHWNGTAWAIVPSPNQETYSSYLDGVAAASASDVWAVGYYRNASGRAQTLIERWNGNAWSVISSPNQDVGDNYLNGVAVVSASDVWAVGYYQNASGRVQTLTEHWDGIAWSVVSSPSPDTYVNHLNRIAAISGNDVWAVGSQDGLTLIEHWNGTAWTVVSSPSPLYDNSLFGIAAVSAADIWAVGSYSEGPNTSRTLVEHWDGTAWSVVSGPNVGTDDNALQGISAVAGSGEVWAVGDSDDDTVRRTLVEKYTTCLPMPTPTVSPPPCTVRQFSDVPVDSTFYSYVRCLACRNILGGYDDGTFRPNNNITRGQIAKVVSNAASFQDDVTGRQTYADVPSTQTFWLWVERLSLHSVMGGYQCGGQGEPCDPQQRPYFRSQNNATRGQLSKIVSNAADIEDPIPSTQQTFEDVPPSHTFWLWIERLALRGAMGGYQCGGAGEPCTPPGNRPYFRPGNNVTRGQAAKIVANTFYPNCQTPNRR